MAGQTAEFEAAFTEAVPLIAASPGFGGLRLERCLEVERRYLLTVEWTSVEDHTKGFRGSEAYGRWRALLHHFYDPFPEVHHYEPFVEA